MKISMTLWELTNILEEAYPNFDANHTSVAVAAIKDDGSTVSIKGLLLETLDEEGVKKLKEEHEKKVNKDGS